MSELLDSGEDDFMPDRIHQVEHGQWCLAENLLAAQGLPIAPFRPREETAEAAGLAEWDELSQRVANVLSAERTFVHDETLDVPSRMAKVRAWLDANENKLGVHPVLFRFARDYLRDKPLEAELYAEPDRNIPSSSIGAFRDNALSDAVSTATIGFRRKPTH